MKKIHVARFREQNAYQKKPLLGPNIIVGGRGKASIPRFHYQAKEKVVRNCGRAFQRKQVKLFNKLRIARVTKSADGRKARAFHDTGRRARLVSSFLFHSRSRSSTI